MIFFLSLKPETPNRGYWDYGMLDDALRTLGLPSAEVSELPECARAVVVIPARHHAGLEMEVDAQLKRIGRVVLFLMGDEEARFKVERIRHGNIEIWVQNPHPGRHDAYHRIGTGYPPQCREVLSGKPFPDKTLRAYFSGQVTHRRRYEMVKALRDVDGVEIHDSGGFAKGFPPEEYYAQLASADAGPCPAGAVIPDSFRVFECLECMTIPLADDVNSQGTVNFWWGFLFGEPPPFPTIKGLEWPALIDECADDYTKTVIRQTAWWVRWKRDFRLTIAGHLGVDVPGGPVTVVIPTSVLPSHPDTATLDETIASVRRHHPDAEIILQIDGLRDEQQDRKADYDEYKLRVLWKCLHEWDNVLPVVFDGLHHQSGMMRETIGLIRTPLLLYVEHDAPLTDDPIDWPTCTEMIEHGEAKTIRFHHEAEIQHEHEHLMLGEVDGGFRRTVQWSQRPHLSTVEYYRDVILPTLPEADFIEDTFHGVCQAGWEEDRESCWDRHRLWIYHPEGNIRRSLHLDGRAGGAKFVGYA